MEPSNQLSNKYYDNLAKIIENSGLQVSPASELWNSSFFQKPRKQIVIVSWIEDRVARPKYLQSAHEFLLTLLKITQIKLLGHKLVWIKHNYQPHAMAYSVFIAPILHKILLLVLSFFSDLKLSHSQSFCSKNVEFNYLPHPRYENTKLTSEKNVDFLVFGRLMRYKGITELIEHWPINLKLKIVGKPENPELQSEIESGIKRRNLLVDFEPHFISDIELDSLLSKTKCVICANIEDSMIASGVVVHALSAGCFVLARHSQFVDELINNGLAVSTFKQMSEISEIIPRLDFSRMDSQYQLFSNLHSNSSASQLMTKLFSD